MLNVEKSKVKNVREKMFFFFLFSFVNERRDY